MPTTRHYHGELLVAKKLLSDPVKQFSIWFKEALKASRGEPHAMALATADKNGRPSARQVLIKDFNSRGFVFFTSYESRKAKEIASNPHAALLFYWPELERQVRIEGKILKISQEESDEYFATRPHGSQIGAWASKQSAPIRSRDALIKKSEAYLKKFEGLQVPRPPQWGGYRVIPKLFEFWSGQPDRLHDRIRYRKRGSEWIMDRLSP